ncbi:hypothetical protein VCHA53O463_110110 [Vibrio chagasii]|nr:hypothetical protein VCHA35P150_20443 [Vibrio chagasii]CAH6906307.1 hypothetical protein VCHA56P515_100052 [Vibrio chagasii]CAH6968366.1 hypothetical protein VCHA53O463_110110 [Vibrio chagasii]CAH7385906.1 hypothetical protein VCHA53O464_20025 [Vibrio chagasii]
MAIIKNRDLDRVGVVVDLHPVEVPPSGFTDATNVRFDGGSVITRKGDLITLEGSIGESIIALIEAEGLWHYATGDKLWRVEPTGEHRDVSREEGDYFFSDYWESTLLSNVIIMSNIVNVPQYINASASTTTFDDLPNWGFEGVDNDPDNPDNHHTWFSPVIRTYGNFLIALGMNENRSDSLPSGDFPQRVRWSAAAQPSQPPFSWNGATLETNAGWNDLSGASGRIVDGVPFQDSFIIYTEKEVFKMDLVGGVDIFSFRKVFDDGGLLGRNCAIEFSGQQFVLGTNDVYVHDTSSKRSVADDQVKQRLFDDISQTEATNIRIHHAELNSEIWILYSSFSVGSGSYPLDKAAVWNYLKRTWTFFTLPNLSCIAFGIRPDAQIDASITWDDLVDNDEITWETTQIPWVGRQIGFGNLGTVAGDVDGNFYLLDSSDSSDMPARSIERVGLNFQEQIDDYISLDRVFPILSSVDGARIEVTITGSHNQSQYPDWEDENAEKYIFTYPDDYKIDCRQSYRFFAIRIVFLDQMPYELSGLDFEVRGLGKR